MQFLLFRLASFFVFPPLALGAFSSEEHLKSPYLDREFEKAAAAPWAKKVDSIGPEVRQKKRMDRCFLRALWVCGISPKSILF